MCCSCNQSINKCLDQARSRTHRSAQNIPSWTLTWERAVGLLLVELLPLLLHLGYDLQLHAAAAAAALTAPHRVLKKEAETIGHADIHQEMFHILRPVVRKGRCAAITWAERQQCGTVALGWLLDCDNTMDFLSHAYKHRLHSSPPPHSPPLRSTASADRSSGCHPACGARHWGCSESSEAPLPLENPTAEDEEMGCQCNKSVYFLTAISSLPEELFWFVLHL